MKQAFVLTLGCPKNQADSDVFSRCLELAGYILSTDPEEADLLVLNSCAFIKPAVDESLETMEQAVQWKGRRRGRRLVLAGCLPGRFTWDESDELKEWDLIIGPGDSAGLMRFLDRELGRKSPGVSGTGPVRYLKVSEGCSNCCSYCTIPSIRGMRRDRSADEIMNDARALAEQGAAEIGVVGQDTAAWSGDPGGLPGLLSRLAGAYPEIWFRPYYIHPSHYSRNLLDVMTRHHNVMPYLDLPVQHVSGRILRRMGRNYDEAFLREMFAQLEDRELSLSVRVTVIAGYPSETEEDFSRLEKFLGDYKCIRTIAAFPYWPEEGTREYRRTLKEELPSAAVVQSRLSRIGDAADTHNMQWAEELEGREMEVLADTEETGHTVLDAPFVDGACIFDRRVVPGLRYSCILSGGTGPDLEASVKDSGSGG